MKSPLFRKPSNLGGQEKSVPAFYEGQDAQGVPDHYVSRQDADTMRAFGKARSIHRGKAILIKGVKPMTAGTRESSKGGWRVVGQTPKPFNRAGNISFPGFPQYQLV